MSCTQIESHQVERSERSRRLGGAWRVVAVLASLGGSFWSQPARADSNDCGPAYEEGQRQLLTARLLEAAQRFRYCASPACPAVMHAECLRFLNRVEASTPSLVVRVHPEIETSARVIVDDLRESVLDGQAIELDPGPHRIEVRAPGYAIAQRRVLLAEGEKLKAIDLALEPLLTRPRADLDASPKRSTPTWPWLATGAVATAGAVGFVYFGLQARAGEDDLDRCRPDCLPAQVSDVKRDYVWANVSLGASVAGLVAMAIWYVAAPAQPSTPSKATAAAHPHQPSRAPAALTLRW